jgi:DUF971 family protein
LIPKNIKIAREDVLYIKWDDDSDSLISFQKLRECCPCATCFAEKESYGKKYFPLLLKDQLQIDRIELVGNYAVSIIWKDGHKTGIYEYSYLKNLAEAD